MSKQNRLETAFRVVTWTHIVAQLTGTWANRLLTPTDVPFAQFGVLQHFARLPSRGQTVGEVTSAFQANQSAITKTLQHLVRKGFLRVERVGDDGRKRVHFVTEAGRAAHQAALARLAPMVAMTFADWTDADIARLDELMGRLKVWLDTHRDTPE
jgi:DNA-binding MarR family transcriptional regulator